ncbi:MAG: hypothetical protein GEU80_16010 [Dehalococcoidia bacterium]|nr:hypothetical protein [Dehalococcoidia bacterium]
MTQGHSSIVQPGGPLAGIRVLDLAGEAAAFAGRQLGELGADVVHIEPPGGDPMRRRSPYVANASEGEHSLHHHLHYNANKRGLVLDLHDEAGRAAFLRLAATADAVIESAPPGEMDRLGLGFEAAREVNPDLLYVTVTPFGQAGPFRDWQGNDLVAAAASGLMYLNGFPDDPPNVPGAEQAYHMGSLVAVASMLVALVGRERGTTPGAHRIDVSMQEAAAMATLQTANANIFTWHGRVPKRVGLAAEATARSLFPCRDGRWISFVVPIGAPALYRGFLDWLEEESLASFPGPDWVDPAYQAAHRPALAPHIEALAARYDRATLFAEGQRRRLLVMPVNDAADLLADAHLEERGSFVRYRRLGRQFTDVAPPYRFSETPAAFRRPAPRLGEHTAEVLADLDRPPAPRERRTAVSEPRSLPLERIRIADFFWLIAGPSASRVFADYGADVVKVESESRIDTIRVVGVQPADGGSSNTNGVFNDCNANKRSVTLDLNHPKGIELAKELVRASDIVTNNFTGDRMDRWGLGYDDLRKVKPDIIMLTMPVMGRSGPYRQYGSYGNGVIAFSGLSTNMGYPHRPPTGIAPLYSDFAAPYFAVSALLAALYHRERTGRGQFIELAQAEAAINLLGPDILEAAEGRLPPRLGNRSRDHAPHGAYRWCAISVRSDEEWRRLAEAIGAPDLAGRWLAIDARRAHEEAVDARIEAWTCARDAWDVARTLQAAGVPAAVVEDLEDMTSRDPWLSTRHLLPVSRDDEGIVFTTHAQPARIDGTVPALRRAPRMGEHNEAVFRDLLGLTESDYIELLAEGVFR